MQTTKQFTVHEMTYKGQSQTDGQSHSVRQFVTDLCRSFHVRQHDAYVYVELSTATKLQYVDDVKQET